MAQKAFSEHLDESLKGRGKADISHFPAEEKKETIEDNTLTETKEPPKTELSGKGAIVINGKGKREKIARTINFDNDLLEKVIKISKDNGISVSEVINQILKQVL